MSLSIGHFKKLAKTVCALVLAGGMVLGGSVTAFAEPSAEEENLAAVAGSTVSSDEPAAEDAAAGNTYRPNTLAGISAALTDYTGNDPAADLELLRASNPYTDIVDSYGNLGIISVNGYVNVREEPGTDGVICGLGFNGDAVDIAGEEDGWYYIHSGDVSGYVSADYVITGDEAEMIALQMLHPRAFMTDDEVMVRTGPGTEYDSVGSVTSGEAYEITDQSVDGWVGIRFGNTAETAYVCADYVETRVGLDSVVEFSGVSSDMTRNAIVDYALQFLGNPYVWGGTSLTNGCDCSGFTMGVLGHFGYSLSHSSACQRNEGIRISPSEAQPGDLICYPGHVGIYIGGGQVVHAACESLGIIVSSMNMMSPICAVNVIGS